MHCIFTAYHTLEEVYNQSHLRNLRSSFTYSHVYNWARKLERMLGKSDNHDFSSWLGNYILKMRYQNICVLI